MLPPTDPGRMRHLRSRRKKPTVSVGWGKAVRKPPFRRHPAGTRQALDCNRNVIETGRNRSVSRRSPGASWFGRLPIRQSANVAAGDSAACLQPDEAASRQRTTKNSTTKPCSTVDRSRGVAGGVLFQSPARWRGDGWPEAGPGSRPVPPEHRILRRPTGRRPWGRAGRPGPGS